MMVLINLLFLLLPFVLLYLIFSSSSHSSPKSEPFIHPHLPWAIALVVLGYNLFAYHFFFKLGFGLFHLFLIGAYLLTLPKENRGNTLITLLSALSVVLAFLPSFRASGAIQGFNLTGYLLTVSTLLLLRANLSVEWQTLPLIGALVTLVIGFVKQPFVLFAHTKQTSSKNYLTFFLKTIPLSLATFLLFAALLAKADPVFAEIIDTLRRQLLQRTLLSLVVSVVIIFILTLRLTPTTSSDQLTKINPLNFLAPGLVLVSLFALFLFVQARTLLFSSDTNTYLQSYGITFSDYVRNGFHHLIVASLLGGVFSWFVFLKSRSTSPTHSSRLKLLGSVLIFELFFLLLSAFKKNQAYVDFYSLTRTRLIGYFFLFWLTGFFTLIFLTGLKNLKERTFLLGFTILSLGMLCVFNLVNIDQLIVASRPTRDYVKVKDYFYINNLSEDAQDGWLQSLAWAQDSWSEFPKNSILTPEEKIVLTNIKLAMVSLLERYSKLENKYGDFDQVKKLNFPNQNDQTTKNVQNSKAYTRWITSRSLLNWNYSEYRAWTKLNQASAKPTAQTIVDQITTYQQTYQISLEDEESRVLYDFKHPFVNIDLRYEPQSFQH